MAIFPLLRKDDILLSDGDWGNYSAKVYSEEKFQKPPETFLKPYMRLYLKAELHGSNESHALQPPQDMGFQSLFTRTKPYVESEARNQQQQQSTESTRRWARISFPCISVSLVNSSKKLEVFLSTCLLSLNECS